MPNRSPTPPSPSDPPSTAPLLDLSCVNLDDLPVALEPGEWDHYLMNAVHENDPDRVRRALDHGANPNTRHPGRGINALHIAAEKGRAWAIPLLVQAGADVEMPTMYSTRIRPLGLAVGIGLALDQVRPCAAALLDAGADPNVEDAEGHSPFRLIVTRYEDPTSSCEQLLQVVDRFLVKGAGRAPDGEGNTVFHWFLVCGHPRVAQYLLDHGIPWSGNRHGETALAVLQHDEPLFGMTTGRSDDPFEQAQREREAALRAVFETFLLRQDLDKPSGLVRTSAPGPVMPRPRL